MSNILCCGYQASRIGIELCPMYRNIRLTHVAWGSYVTLESAQSPLFDAIWVDLPPKRVSEVLKVLWSYLHSQCRRADRHNQAIICATWCSARMQRYKPGGKFQVFSQACVTCQYNMPVQHAVMSQNTHTFSKCSVNSNT